MEEASRYTGTLHPRILIRPIQVVLRGKQWNILSKKKIVLSLFVWYPVNLILSQFPGVALQRIREKQNTFDNKDKPHSKLVRPYLGNTKK